MSNAAAARVSPSDGENSQFFDPDDYLLGLVRRAIAKEQNVIIGLAGVGEMWIVPERGEYFTEIPLEKMQSFCCRPAKDYTVKKLGDGELKSLVQRGRLGRNIDEIMWHAALCASKGRLIKGCRRDDVVLLKHWPNLTRLATSPNAIRIAALLTRHPTSVTLAYHLLKVPAAEMNEFYSAAHSAGMTVAVNRKPDTTVQTDLKPHKQRGLLTLILSRIASL